MACASTDNCTHADHRIILSALRHLRRNQRNLKSTWNPRNIYVLLRDIVTAQRILRACGLRRSGVNLVSCPTCGRTAYDMIPLAEELERRLEDCDKPITVAVMGCVVNGPGEASAADIGVAGGKGEGLIFRHGEVLYKVAQEKLLDALLEEIEKL